MGTAQLIRQAGAFPSDPSARKTVMCIAPAKIESVPALRAFARAAGRAWGMAADTVDSLALIVTELVANACQHSGSAQVAVLLLADRHCVVARVSDTGRWKSTPHSMLENDEATSGRGLEIVRACATDVDIQSGNRGTNITATLSAGCAFAGVEPSPLPAGLLTAGV